MKKYILILLSMSVLFTVSCRKYVDVEQVDSRVLKYTADYQYLLNNLSVFEYTYGYPILSCDDSGIDSLTYQNTLSTQWSLTYTWSPTRYSDTETDNDWERFYKQIYVCNEITDGVESSEKGTAAEKSYILAQAKVQRAYAYLNLVNLYAKPYTAASSATDPGVPLLTTGDLFASLKRASVAETYNQIISDLKTAVPALPDLPDYNTNPSRAAAYALLAETYLQMRDFTSAGEYAAQALSLQHTLTDLNAFKSAPATLPKRLADPELILSKMIGGTYLPTLSGSLLSLLGTKDLRYTLFTGLNSATMKYGRSYYKANYTGESVNAGPNVPEMMLISAECAARANDAGKAVSLLNTLRKTRFSAADYQDLTAASADEALQLVIDERRRELFGRGLRWFDQRRLNQDAAFAKTYTRTFKGVTYTLAPNSNQYTYAIADKYILLNPEIEQNPL